MRGIDGIWHTSPTLIISWPQALVDPSSDDPVHLVRVLVSTCVLSFDSNEVACRESELLKHDPYWTPLCASWAICLSRTASPRFMGYLPIASRRALESLPTASRVIDRASHLTPYSASRGGTQRHG
jgi:hypothetical protein